MQEVTVKARRWVSVGDEGLATEEVYEENTPEGVEPESYRADTSCHYKKNDSDWPGSHVLPRGRHHVTPPMSLESSWMKECFDPCSFTIKKSTSVTGPSHRLQWGCSSKCLPHD
ncbi:unnamed protein product [Arctogadus glacialis]